MTRMDELTQTQIILLTLLVSFITSIATGIITASLLAEAPSSVTQTINRVVEHTIEKVVPTTEVSTGGNTVKEVTVVREEDAVLAAIEKSARSVVRIYNPSTSSADRGEFYGLGIIVSKDGLVVSDLRQKNFRGVFTVQLADGTSVEARMIQDGFTEELVLFRIITTENLNTFSQVVLSPNEPKLGQSVIAIEGREKNSVALGRVLSIQTIREENPEGESVDVAYSVLTDVNSSGGVAGSPLFNLSGELIGIKTSNRDLSIPQGVYTTVVPVNRVIDKVR